MREHAEPANVAAQAFTVFRATAQHVREAREAVTELHLRTLYDEPGLSAFLSDPACYLLLAVQDNVVAGSLNGYALRHPHRAQPLFLLYEIDVRPAYQQRGIGKALVNAFTAEARAAGAYQLWVVTNELNVAAMAMYRACGYGRPNPDDVMLNMAL